MKTKLAIILLHLAANSADAYFTHRNAMPAFNNPQHYQFREYNTVARPFVTRGTAPLVGYFAVASAAELVTAYELDKHHHRKARDWLGSVHHRESCGWRGNECDSPIYTMPEPLRRPTMNAAATPSVSLHWDQ
jgi:hypothetical protein